MCTETFLSNDLKTAFESENDRKRKLKIAYALGCTSGTFKNLYHLSLAVHDSDHSEGQRNKIWTDILKKWQKENKYIHMSDLIDIISTTQVVQKTGGVKCTQGDKIRFENKITAGSAA